MSCTIFCMNYVRIIVASAMTIWMLCMNWFGYLFSLWNSRINFLSLIPYHCMKNHIPHDNLLACLTILFIVDVFEKELKNECKSVIIRVENARYHIAEKTSLLQKGVHAEGTLTCQLLICLKWGHLVTVISKWASPELYLMPAFVWLADLISRNELKENYFS